MRKHTGAQEAHRGTLRELRVRRACARLLLEGSPASMRLLSTSHAPAMLVARTSRCAPAPTAWPIGCARPLMQAVPNTRRTALLPSNTPAHMRPRPAKAGQAAALACAGLPRGSHAADATRCPRTAHLTALYTAHSHSRQRLGRARRRPRRGCSRWTRSCAAPRRSWRQPRRAWRPRPPRRAALPRAPPGRPPRARARARMQAGSRPAARPARLHAGELRAAGGRERRRTRSGPGQALRLAAAAAAASPATSRTPARSCGSAARRTQRPARPARRGGTCWALSSTPARAAPRGHALAAPRCPRACLSGSRPRCGALARRAAATPGCVAMRPRRPPCWPRGSRAAARGPPQIGPTVTERAERARQALGRPAKRAAAAAAMRAMRASWSAFSPRRRRTATPRGAGTTVAPAACRTQPRRAHPRPRAARVPRRPTPMPLRAGPPARRRAWRSRASIGALPGRPLAMPSRAAQDAGMSQPPTCPAVRRRGTAGAMAGCATRRPARTARRRAGRPARRTTRGRVGREARAPRRRRSGH